MKFTFIYCYNNETELNGLLRPSLELLRKNNEIDFNEISIENISGRYSSASEAYNSECRKESEILGEILIFCHQDIAFDNASLFKAAIKEFNEDSNQILGVAGMPKNGRTISNLRYYLTKKYITETRVLNKSVVESLDECLIMIPRNLFEKIYFDVKTCDHWHLYVVDLCYALRRKFGTISYVMPQQIYHKTNGGTGLYVDYHFLKTLGKMVHKYKKDFDFIYTPCYIVKTNFIYAWMKLSKSALKNLFIHRT